MSREIKFRAWRKDINKMISAGVPIVEEGAKLELIFGDSRYAWVFVEPELSMVMGTPRDSELMQFTGLLDTNSKEIYEGDILRWEYPAGYSLAEVKFGLYNNGELYDDNVSGNGWYLRERSHFTNDYEREVAIHPFIPEEYPFGPYLPQVIGNIYENPELLGGSDDDATA